MLQTVGASQPESQMMTSQMKYFSLWPNQEMLPSNLAHVKKNHHYPWAILVIDYLYFTQGTV